jgi:DNA adenine methylase
LNEPQPKSPVQPLLKWAGGKRWLAKPLSILLERRAYRRVVEPFAGGAALFFRCAPQHGLLGDTNADLMACYRTLRDSPDELHIALSALTIDQHTFNLIRRWTPRDDFAKALRLLYLNRTAFGGLWRVNRDGEFNVPFGCKPGTALPNSATLSSTAAALQGADLYVGDFTSGLRAIAEDDVIYCDPPYTVTHNDNGFIRYNERIFSWSDQRRLAKEVSALASAGSRVVVSNAAHRDVLELYPGTLFLKLLIRRDSMLAANPKFRGSRREALILARSMIHDGPPAETCLERGGLTIDGHIGR